ncbi:MAG: hypothetical protein A3F54_04825 [Candidatus Kerfeldbacteria bacterium RIFCSPHIGHO2_12_FULL_48_17]|uniref:Uncharacterized protein n=1 Tax=Candidatus Kerfeldbacteria bacterium RIFCSPHIGHO2_12_FULL_48_17 TaxID=1798542 RepID=A0A1G2B3A6_9BACT|nr:MAG: hypothetical protein A3F54_04825 [Candidatus Kerfeldbacteria bacterium RIFCSPHIGHO2_12_FULL_48_17]
MDLGNEKIFLKVEMFSISAFSLKGAALATLVEQNQMAMSISCSKFAGHAQRPLRKYMHPYRGSQ